MKNVILNLCSDDQFHLLDMQGPVCGSPVMRRPRELLPGESANFAVCEDCLGIVAKARGLTVRELMAKVARVGLGE